MLKALTAHTSEIDDVEAALSEVLDQLDIDGSLLKNSIGILTCYYDFIESGVVSALRDALPFDVVGSTTICGAAPYASGPMILTIMVLTSDDVSFSAGLSSPLMSEDEDVIREAYDAALKNAKGEPSLILSFAPLLNNISVDFYSNALSKISGGVPNFGMVSVDHKTDYHKSRVIYNGEAYVNNYAFILLSGSVNSRFFTSSIPTDKILRGKGIVTSSIGNRLKTVNGMPSADFLETLGLPKNDEGKIMGINTFPLIVDCNDGTPPIVWAIYAQTPEGDVICGGIIPEGATLSVGSMTADDVIKTATDTTTSALGVEKINCILMFSCVGRYFYMGNNPTAEIDKIRQIMAKTDIPYQFAYSGGEICPVYTEGRENKPAINRGHNFTLVICVL
jgi:hypothetical protein